MNDTDVRINIQEEEEEEEEEERDSLPETLDNSEEDSDSKKRRKGLYTVIARSGFQNTEYTTIMAHLCKAEIVISLLFLVQGVVCPGYGDQPAYQGTCHMNVVSAIVGIITGCIGIGAINRYRWRTMLVVWLVLCIISAVGNLLSVIHAGVWLDQLSKLKERTGFVNGLTGAMLLGSVAVGVCFILTAVMICHYWSSNSAHYQAIGRVSVGLALILIFSIFKGCFLRQKSLNYGKAHRSRRHNHRHNRNHDVFLSTTSSRSNSADIKRFRRENQTKKLHG